MPTFTTNLQQQLQASSAGNYAFPQIPQIKSDSLITEEFTRTTLNPTNAVAIYTATSNDTNGTATLTGIRGQLVLLTDSSTIGDDEDVRTSELSLIRSAFFGLGNRSSIKITILFALSTSTTATEGFVGLSFGNSALSALPTTVRHIGLFWDASAQANFILTSANGSAQATTDTGEALDASVHRLEITWSGDDSAVIDYFTASTDTTPFATQTVTSLSVNTNNRGGELHFFVQTEGAAAKGLTIFGWKAEVK